MAADFNMDGRTDLYVTSAGYNVATDSCDALLWNNGDGTFTEGAVQAGINGKGWHSAAVVGDVNGDGRPDLFVSSYTDPNFVVDPASGFPSDHAPVRDLLYLNEGTDGDGHSTFREVARPAGIERTKIGHGLGATFTDFNRDGRLDLYVANDADPNQLYENVALKGVPTPIPSTWASASRTSRNVRRSPTRTRAWESRHRTSPATDGPTSSSRTRATSCTPPTGASRRRRARHSPTRDPSSQLQSDRTRQAGACHGPTWTWTAISTSSWRTARFRS